MEVELVWGEPREIRVLDEPLALRAVVVLDEVREGAVPESKRDPFTFDVLLTHAGNNLHITQNGYDLCYTL